MFSSRSADGGVNSLLQPTVPGGLCTTDLRPSSALAMSASKKSFSARVKSITPLRIIFWLIQALWLAAAVSLGVGTTRDEAPIHKDLGQAHAVIGSAVVAPAAGVVGTADKGLLLGAAQVNPLEPQSSAPARDWSRE
jgi:hypothetical protein